MYHIDKTTTTDHGHTPTKTDNTTDLTITHDLRELFFVLFLP